jgi:hypothetical protein
MAFQLFSKGAGKEERIQRTTIERKQRGGNKNSISFMNYNIFSVFTVVIF